MGATLALRLAMSGRFRAVGAFYGFVPRHADWERFCPVVASFGGRDRLVRHRGERLQHLLAQHGVPHDVKCYPAAGHSFLGGAGPGWQSSLLSLRHDPTAAADAWDRTITFLRTHV
jgi:carboxymethylenebutenolidase